MLDDDPTALVILYVQFFPSRELALVYPSGKNSANAIILFLSTTTCRHGGTCPPQIHLKPQSFSTLPPLCSFPTPQRIHRTHPVRRPPAMAAVAAHGGDYLQRFVAETEWYNEIVLSAVAPGNWWRGLPHPVQSWLRNCVGGYLLYYISGFLWCFVIYYWKRNAYIPKDAVPTNEAMKKQIIVASKAMPFYCALPALSEYMIESGWTRCFFNISEVGVPMYFINLALYLIFVEFGIYWMHRELHDIKPLYKYLHATHHIYNKENTLSPFAGLAFHPMDGILQAVPHVLALFIFPTHFRTHIALIFLEAVWTANIHDCIHGKVWPVMGAGYHTIHHTTYRHNYGHYTIWMDWMFGTLREPVDILKNE